MRISKTGRPVRVIVTLDITPSELVFDPFTFAPAPETVVTAAITLFALAAPIDPPEKSRAPLIVVDPLTVNVASVFENEILPDESHCMMSVDPGAAAGSVSV
jgi:hypothetical protein